MEPFAVFAIATLVAGTLVGRFLLKIRPAQSTQDAHLGAWTDAARACDLEGVETEGLSLTGRSGPLHVHLERYVGEQDQGTRIRFRGLLADLTIRPQGLGDALSGLRGVEEVVLGDDVFDKAAWVRGDAVQVRALLDHDCRRILRNLFEGRLEHEGASTLWVTGRVDDGELILDAPTSITTRRTPEDDPVHVTSLHLMPHVLRAGLKLARRLLPLEEPVLRLAENLANEPVAEVRLRLLGLLLEDFPGHSATREALAAAGEDPSAAVRFRAALALGGRKGRAVLVDLARGHGADDATTARAVEALGRSLTTPEAEELLRGALRTRREATALACMKALGRRGTAEVTPMLARVLAVERGPLGEAAAVALAENGDPGAEEPLLRALEEGPVEVRAAAARALGRVGSAAAVAPLRRAEARAGTLRSAARQAIAEIQARLTGTGGASAGQLSLSAGQSGQVSLADDTAGRVSLPTPGPADAEDDGP